VLQQAHAIHGARRAGNGDDQAPWFYIRHRSEL
jgi:hypothetical protein